MKLSRLRARWWREQYRPTWLGLLINPFYFARRGLLTELRPLFPELKGAVLDVGCGNKPYRSLIPATSYTGLDVDTPFTRKVGAADVFYDGTVFPLASETFDGVICSQVLEHVFTPEKFLGEIHRVLKPGGVLVLAVPFLWDEHEQPYDFGRYSSFGLKALLERNGFEISVQRKSVKDARAVAQLVTAWIFKAIPLRNRWALLVRQLLLIAPIHVVGVILGAVLPDNADFFLDNVVLARKRAPA